MSGELQPKVLCIYASPRAGGNTDHLMDAFVRGVEQGGGRVERVYLRTLTIAPCNVNEACIVIGQCNIDDDMIPLYAKLAGADGVALATPIMFYGPSAIAKAFIDRCQAFWNKKYVNEEKVGHPRYAPARGALLSVGASTGQKLFDGLRLTFKYFLDTFDAVPAVELLFRGLDEKGAILNHPDHLAEAVAQGREFVARIVGEREGVP